MFKSFVLLLPFFLAGSASPVEQTPLGGSLRHSEMSTFEAALAGDVQYPGFSLNLNEMRLVQMEDKAPTWMTEREKIIAKAQGVRFYDVTDVRNLEGSAPVRVQKNSPYTVSATPQLKDKIGKAISVLSKEEMQSNLEKFSSFRTRYYLSSTGKESQQWLLSTISEITETYADEDLKTAITISEFPHRWNQNSIVARITGTADEDDGIVILGAHQDSTNLIPFLPAPGADDDGSGTVTILEAYRALLSSGFKPNKTVEFHWYSAEEGGLLGSQAMTEDYAQRGVNVYAMVQMDMTAFIKAGTDEVMGLGTDKEVNLDLVEHNKKLIETYCDLPWKETKCGYACSDHGSWGKAGYPSSFVTESRFEDMSPYIHSTNDRIDKSEEFSFDHMLQFAKLGVAYVSETAGWV